MTKIGFTGTQKGMTQEQKDAFTALLTRAKPVEEFHHGDCIGADADAHVIAAAVAYNIVIHPPRHNKKRAWCSCWVGDSSFIFTILPRKDYLARNHDIVDAVDILIATPAERDEQTRSGTWATIRYARRMGRLHYIIFPEGDMEIR